MTTGRVIWPEAVIRRIAGAMRPEDVLDVLTTRAGQLGFSVLAIGAPHRNRDFADYFYSTWPAAWIDVYVAEKLVEHDPLPEAAALNLMPFRWSDLLAGRAGMRLTAAQRHGFAVGAAHGYRDGVCVPIHGPAGCLVIGSYAGDPPDIPDAVLAELHILTLHAHVRLAALHAHRTERAGGAAAPALSRREIEALRCVFAGLTDAGAGRTMGVGVRTARFHIDNARRKLGARTRAQAVAAAVAAGLLGP